MKRDSITFKGKAANDAFMALSGKPPSSPSPCSVKCSLCNWTNVGLMNLGEPGSPKMVCHGCCKRMLEALEKLRDGDFAGTPINHGSSAMMLIEETLSPNSDLRSEAKAKYG